MAKVPFSKLNKTKSIPAEKIFIEGIEITIEQYLSLSAKLQLIQDVIELSGSGEEGFFNIVKLQTFYTIEMIKAYTNITFTEKQQEDPAKLYDNIILNKVWEKVAEKIPAEEQDYIWGNILNLAREVTNYNHSVLGILKTVSSDYTNTDFDIEAINEKIKDPNTLQLLKEVVNKMG